MVALAILLVFLLALGFCVWGLIASCRLMFKGFRGILAPTTQKRPPESQPKARENVTRPLYPSGQLNSSRTTWPPVLRAGRPTSSTPSHY
jgi:hypothetical protein